MGDAACCWELAESRGWHVVVSLRLARLWRGLFAKVAQAHGWAQVFANAEIGGNIASFLWRA